MKDLNRIARNLANQEHLAAKITASEGIINRVAGSVFMASDEDVVKVMSHLFDQMVKKVGADKMKSVLEEGKKEVLVYQVQNKLVYLAQDIASGNKLNGFEKPPVDEKELEEFKNMTDARKWTFARKCIINWAKKNEINFDTEKLIK